MILSIHLLDIFKNTVRPLLCDDPRDSWRDGADQEEIQERYFMT